MDGVVAGIRDKQSTQRYRTRVVVVKGSVGAQTAECGVEVRSWQSDIATNATDETALFTPTTTTLARAQDVGALKRQLDTDRRKARAG